jgi:hypothetical protein
VNRQAESRSTQWVARRTLPFDRATIRTQGAGLSFLTSEAIWIYMEMPVARIL